MIAARALPETVFNHLSLLLHSVRPERLARFHSVGVRTRAHPERSVDQLAELGDHAPGKVDPRSPGLVLSAMGQLMGEHPQVSFASIRQEYLIAQGNRSVTAGPEDNPP
jgi:hypothetical protein